MKIKFGIEMKEGLMDMTNDEVLDVYSYVANMADMHHNSMDLVKITDDVDNNNNIDSGNDSDKEDEY